MPSGNIVRAAQRVAAFAGTPKVICGLLALLLALLSPSPVNAADLADAVAGLGGESFAAKEKAIVALGKTGDPKAVPILQALGDDRLRTAPGGRIVLVSTTGGRAILFDAATGEELKNLAPDSLERIIVNNRLRGAIEAALGALGLFSPDRAARLAAAQDVLKHPSPEAMALLEKATAAEQEADIRDAMRRSLAAAHLFSGSKQEQLAAVRALASVTDPQVKNLL